MEHFNNQMTVEFDSVSKNESFARVVVAAFVTRLNPTLEEIADIKTAVSEAVTNSIIHGYENKDGERVVDCIYDDAKEQNEFGYCAVKKDGLWGVLKSDGTVLMQPKENLDEYLYVDFIDEWHRMNDLTLNAYTK